VGRGIAGMSARGNGRMGVVGDQSAEFAIASRTGPAVSSAAWSQAVSLAVLLVDAVVQAVWRCGRIMDRQNNRPEWRKKRVFWRVDWRFFGSDYGISKVQRRRVWILRRTLALVTVLGNVANRVRGYNVDSGFAKPVTCLRRSS
jgi:hypothetical protein